MRRQVSRERENESGREESYPAEVCQVKREEEEEEDEGEEEKQNDELVSEMT